MALINQEIIRNNNQEEHDYADTLEPGYRFCPTDPELIVYYLKPKIETGKQHPKGRFYEVNIYDYSPDELTAKPEYRSSENKWYFLTWTEQKHPNGTRPNRQTRNGGTWKASQSCAPVQDVTRRVVGSKLSLVYLDEKKRKTPWLMQEYTTKIPNIPKENRNHNMDNNKVTQWVLCKIYKTVVSQNASNNLADQEVATVEQNHQLEDEPKLRHRRLSMDQESYQSNGHEHAQIQEINHHSGTEVQIVAPMQYMLASNQQSDLNNVQVGSSQTFPAISMNTSPNLITMQQMPMFSDSNLIQPPFEDPPKAFEIEQVQPSSGSSTFKYYENQSCPSLTESIRFSCGASCSSSMVLPQEEDATGNVAQLDDIMTRLAEAPAVQMDTNLDSMTSSHTLMDDVFQQDFKNSYYDTASLYEEPTMVPEADQYSNADIVMGLENFLNFDPSECISIDELMDAHNDESEIEQVQPSSGSLTFEYYQNQSCPSSTESIRFWSGAFSSSSMVLPQEEDATRHVAQADDIISCPDQSQAVQMDTNLNPMTFSQTLMDDVFQQDFQNSYHDTPRLYEEPTMVPEADQYSSYNADSVIGLENFLSLDLSECVSIVADLMEGFD